jgi:hypothetical protein
MRKPEPYQVALLLLSLVVEREKVLKAAGKETAVSRFRMSEATFRRLAKRNRIPPDFFAEVQDWLFDAGWSLFFTGSSYYAMIKTDAVDGWVRLGSKRIDDQLAAVERGTFDFDSLAHLLARPREGGDDGGDDG